MFNARSRLKNDRRAVTALEYGLIAALLAVIVIGSLEALGTNMATAFTAVTTSVASTAGT